MFFIFFHNYQWLFITSCPSTASNATLRPADGKADHLLHLSELTSIRHTRPQQGTLPFSFPPGLYYNLIEILYQAQLSPGCFYRQTFISPSSILPPRPSSQISQPASELLGWSAARSRFFTSFREKSVSGCFYGALLSFCLRHRVGCGISFPLRSSTSSHLLLIHIVKDSQIILTHLTHGSAVKAGSQACGSNAAGV